MKTRFGTLLTVMLAAAIACGGSQQVTEEKEKVFVEASAAITIADPAAVADVQAFLCATGTCTAAELAATPAFSGSLVYSQTKGTFGGNIFLAPNTGTQTYRIVVTLHKASDTTVIWSNFASATVKSGALTNVSLSIASTPELPANVGFIVTATAGPGYIAPGAPGGGFSVTVAQPAGAPAPTYKWEQFVKGTETSKTPTLCNGTLSPDNAPSVTFSDSTTEICYLKVTITDSINSAFTATRAFTVGVGVNVSIGGTFVPSPTITKLDLAGNGGYTGTWDTTRTPAVPKKLSPAEATCTLYRVDTMVSGTLVPASQSCPGLYTINTGLDPYPEWDGQGTPPPLPALTPTQFAIGVTYDLGGIFDPAKPPTVGVTVSCPGAATNGVAPYTFSSTPENPIAGSGPGYWDPATKLQACPPGPAVCTGSSILPWTQPSAFAGTGTSSLCTLTVTVKNQGAVDSFPAQVWIKK